MDYLVQALERWVREFTHRYPQIEIRGCRARVVVHDVLEDSIKYMVDLPKLFPMSLESRVWRRCKKKQQLLGAVDVDYAECVFIYRLKSCGAGQYGQG